MKRLIPCFALLSMLAFGASAKEPELIAVKFHADWCGSCKAMGPVVDELRNKLDGKPVLFVELDRTNQTSSNEAVLLAGALGLSKLYEENAGTGFILLVDSKTKKPVAKFTKAQSTKEIGKEILARLQ